MTGFSRSISSTDDVFGLVRSIEPQKSRRSITSAVFLCAKLNFDSVTHQTILDALSKRRKLVDASRDGSKVTTQMHLHSYICRRYRTGHNH